VNYWLQSLDYVSRPTSRNSRQAHVDTDAKIRFVLAHSDPGVRNWLDVGGHPRGGALFRAALTPTAPQPVATVVPLAEVHGALPADTPAFSPEDRTAELVERRAHVAARFRW
jgi:hypothetical protein